MSENMVQYRCCFAGHNKYYDANMNSKIRETATNLIEQFGVKEFWVGQHGGFDSCAAQVIRDLKKEYPYIELILVIPYITKFLNESKDIYYQKYACILVADIPLNTPPRFKILKTNQYMVDKSNFLICCVDHSWGGAAQTLEYAQKKQHITVINLES